MPTTTNNFPTHVLLTTIGEKGFHWSGSNKIQNMPRLYAESVQQKTDSNTVAIDFSVVEDKRSQDIYLLTAKANTHVSLVCQRCLDMCEKEVSTHVELVLIADESLQTLLTEDEDYISLSDIPNFDFKKGLDVKTLIEDELLLVLPVSPKHEDCDMSVTSYGEIAEEVEEEEENPFAALVALKGSL